MSATLPKEAAGVAVVIPCYRVRKSILALLSDIPASVSAIYVVDDQCPEHSGQYVKENNADPRVRVIFNARNLGVGGAVMTGYDAAIADGMDILVKLDGDGQMDPGLLPAFVTPILQGEADYTKGNRFFDSETMHSMPPLRLVGNIGLSFLTKLSSGYWNLFDPTNGYTAIHAKVAATLPLEKISQRYFFESDILFRLNTVRAVVMDIPMYAKYEDEESSLAIKQQLPVFLAGNIRNTFKRIYYGYFIRNFNFASIELVFGLLLVAFGVIFGSDAWLRSYREAAFASAGTVMLAAMPIIIGFQLLLGFFNFDANNIPSSPLHKRLHADARSLSKSQRRRSGGSASNNKKGNAS